MEAVKRWARRALVVALAAALLGLCAGLTARHVGQARFEEEMRLLRASGAPATPDQLAPPALPVARNAARLYRAAALLVDTPSEEEGPIFDMRLDAAIDGQISATARWEEAGGPVDGETARRDLRAAVSRSARALALVHEAAAIPGACFDLHYEDGPATSTDHLMELRALSRLALAEGRLALLEGRPDDAYRSALAALAAAHATAAEPLLVSRLVTIANQSRALRFLEDALLSGPPDERTSAELAAVLARFDDTSLARALDGERVSFLLAVREAGSLGFIGYIEPYDFPVIGRWLAGTSRAVIAQVHGWFLAELDGAVGLRHFREQAARWSRPCPAAHEGAPDPETPSYALLTDLLLPVLGKAAEAEGGARARTALARLAIERARGAPATALPVDPFTGKPMLSRVEGDRLVVYSVGPDRKDDGGRSEQDAEGADDIAWRMRK